MTIAKGQNWGQVVPRPDGLRLVPDDASLARALTDGSGQAVAPTGGDLHKTLGGRVVASSGEVLALPIDLLTVDVDGAGWFTGCAHVVMHSPWYRGGWWRGPLTMVMNAEFIGPWHVVTRGHPNDGRAEVCSWGSDFGVRDRIAARRRLPMAAHVPHPLIETRSVRTSTFRFDRPVVVRIDGRQVASGCIVEIRVRADAALVHA